MRKLVFVIIGLFALFTLIRAYTDSTSVQKQPAAVKTVFSDGGTR